MAVCLRSSEGESNAMTRDVSSNGMFLSTRSKLTVDSAVELEARIPLGNSAFPAMPILYAGRVVRVEVLTSDEFGIAVCFSRYEYLV